MHIDGGQAGQKLVREYLQAAQKENDAAGRTLKRVRMVDKLGWHGGAYVTPSGTIGETEGESIVFQGTAPEYGRTGTVEGWRDHVAKPLSGNSRLVMALCCSFAGPLLDISGEESGGLHLQGRSSDGKTTALHAGGSVWGKPRSYVRQWRATANGLEGLVAVHNDGALFLDELGQAEGKEAGAAAYMLANGGAKVRMSKAITVRPGATWRVLFLSSGEVSLTTLVESAGKRAMAGQELRLATIPADAGAGHGLFEDLHGYESGHAFSSALAQAVAEHHGTAGNAFLAKLVDAR